VSGIGRASPTRKFIEVIEGRDVPRHLVAGATVGGLIGRGEGGREVGFGISHKEKSVK